MPKSIAIISPHLDDAALSCGAYIADLLKNKHQVTIITLFTSFKTTLIPQYSKEYMYKCGAKGTKDFELLRKEEDQQAMSLLKVKYLYGNFSDGGFRSIGAKNLYPTFSSLFSGKVSKNDYEIQQAVASFIQSIEPNYSNFVFPLGIGGHADHLIAKECSKFIGGGKVSYYLDIPYGIQVKNWTFELGIKMLTYKKKRYLTTKLKQKVLNKYSTQIPLLFPSGIPAFNEIIFFPR